MISWLRTPHALKDARKGVVDAAVAALAERPETFTLDRFQLVDTKSGFEYWISSGTMFVRVVKPYDFDLGFRQSARLLVAVDQFKAGDILKRAQMAQGRANAPDT